MPATKAGMEMPIKESPVSVKSQNEYWRNPVKMPLLTPSTQPRNSAAAMRMSVFCSRWTSTSPTGSPFLKR